MRIRSRRTASDGMTEATAAEAFPTRSLLGLVPIVRVRPQALDRGTPGSYTLRLMAVCLALVDRECQVGP